jgi:hypothetical protein
MIIFQIHGAIPPLSTQRLQKHQICPTDKAKETLIGSSHLVVLDPFHHMRSRYPLHYFNPTALIKQGTRKHS